MRARIYRFSYLCRIKPSAFQVQSEFVWPEDAVITLLSEKKYYSEFIVLSETFDDIPLPELLNHCGWLPAEKN